MTQTTNLEITHNQANQNQPEVTLNAAEDTLDAAIASQLSVTVAGSDVDASSGSNKTNFLKQVYVKFTGTLTAGVAYLLPSNKHFFIAEHAASGNFDITVKRSGQTGVLLRPGDKMLIYNDGTDARLVNDLTTYLPVYVSGKPGAGQVVLRLVAPFNFTFKANMRGAYGTNKTNPTATATFTYKKNGSSFATVDISTSSVYTFTQASDASFARGTDVLTVEAPGSQDATLDDVNIVTPVVR